MRNWLIEARKSKKITQQNVAKALKISQQMYSAIERGKRNKDLRLETIIKLAKFFKMSNSEIIKNECNERIGGTK